MNLFLAVFFTVIWLVGFRLFKTFQINTFQAVVFNYWTCVITGILTFQQKNLFSSENFALVWLKYAFILGGIFIITFYLTALCTQKIGLTITTVAAKISLIVPVLFSLWVFQSNQKNFDFINYLGITLALVAIVFSSWKDEKSDNQQLSVWLNFGFPLLIFALNGATDTTVNYLNWRFIQPEQSALFSIITFAGAGFFGFLGLIYRFGRLKEGFQGKNLVAGISIGVPNFFSLYFLLLALADFKNDGAFLYPVFNILIILLSAISAIILFQEKLNFLNKIGLGLAVLAIFLLAYQEIIQQIY